MFRKMSCTNCGSELLQGFTDKGLAIKFCGSLKSNVVRTVNQVPVYVELFCETIKDGTPLHSFLKQAEGKLRPDELAAAVRFTVPMATLIPRAVRLLLMDIPAKHIPMLLEAIYDIAMALGLNMDKATDRLVLGLANKSNRRLDNFSMQWIYEKEVTAFMKKNKVQRDIAWRTMAVSRIVEVAARL